MSQGGSWDSEYGRFFLGWYSGALIAHGDRVLGAAAQALGRRGRPRRARAVAEVWAWGVALSHQQLQWKDELWVDERLCCLECVSSVQRRGPRACSPWPRSCFEVTHYSNIKLAGACRISNPSSTPCPSVRRPGAAVQHAVRHAVCKLAAVRTALSRGNSLVVRAG